MVSVAVLSTDRKAVLVGGRRRQSGDFTVFVAKRSRREEVDVSKDKKYD